MQEPLTLADLAGVDILLSEDERLVQDTVRRFVRERYLPRAAEFFENESFPLDLVPELAELMMVEMVKRLFAKNIERAPGAAGRLRCGSSGQIPDGDFARSLVVRFR